MFERFLQPALPGGTVAVTFDGRLRTLVTVAAIVFGALILHFVVSRGVARLVSRLAAFRRKRRERDISVGVPVPEAAGAPEPDVQGAARAPAEQEERAEQRIRTLGVLLRHTAGVVILVVAGIMVLGELGVNIGPLLAGAGVAGIALAFGAQALVRDYLTGIFMLVEDQYGVGDIVDIGEASGVVERVTLRLTVVRDVEGTLWYVPNGEIRRVGNKSYQWARAVLDIGVAYDADIAAASKVIKEVADGLWREAVPGAAIIEEPEIWGVEDLGPQAVSIRLAVKTLPGQQWAVGRALRARIKEALHAAGIAIPFPQQTVWFQDAGRARTGPGAGSEERDRQ